MSPIDSYVAELRTALGDRLPPSVHEARLREARSHLLASAEDVGEREAIRRYGRVRAVANGLVRAHRGYDGRSAWVLGLPLGASFLAVALGCFLLKRVGSDEAIAASAPIGGALMILFPVGFFLRALQTRRWLAWPLAASHAALLVLATALAHIAPQRVYKSETRDGVVRTRRLAPEETARFLAAHPQARRPEGVARSEAVAVAVWATAFGGAWLFVNALALGAGSLLDLRGVRRAR